jgi:rhodanese-related sulfurtransferase
MVEEMTPEQLHERLANGDRDSLQVVDIRTEAEFREGHVPGAINVPFPEFPERIGAVDWGEEIVCVCPIGQSSLQAARLLEAYEGVDPGATVANLEGGYEAYDYDLERGD